MILTESHVHTWSALTGQRVALSARRQVGDAVVQSAGQKYGTAIGASLRTPPSSTQSTNAIQLRESIFCRWVRKMELPTVT